MANSELTHTNAHGRRLNAIGDYSRRGNSAIQSTAFKTHTAMTKHITKPVIIAAAVGVVAGGVLAYLNGTFDNFVKGIATKIAPAPKA